MKESNVEVDSSSPTNKTYTILGNSENKMKFPMKRMRFVEDVYLRIIIEFWIKSRIYKKMWKTVQIG